MLQNHMLQNHIKYQNNVKECYMLQNITHVTIQYYITYLILIAVFIPACYVDAIQYDIMRKNCSVLIALVFEIPPQGRNVRFSRGGGGDMTW